jgi:hypothetical protein
VRLSRIASTGLTMLRIVSAYCLFVKRVIHNLPSLWAIFVCNTILYYIVLRAARCLKLSALAAAIRSGGSSASGR